MVLAWAPIRAVCTVVGIVLAIHIAGPIADLVDGEPVGAAVAAKGAPDKSTLIPAEQAVAEAIKARDRRYMSMRQCVDEVSGYPRRPAETCKDVASPWTIGVKLLEACLAPTKAWATMRERAHEQTGRLRCRIQPAHRQLTQQVGGARADERALGWISNVHQFTGRVRSSRDAADGGGVDRQRAFGGEPEQVVRTACLWAGLRPESPSPPKPPAPHRPRQSCCG